MSSHYRKLTSLAIFIAPLLAIFLVLLTPPTVQGTGPERQPPADGELGHTRQLTETMSLYMPFVPVNLGPESTLQWLQTFDSEGHLQAAYLVGEGFEYRLSAINERTVPITIRLNLSHLGPCGTTQVYEGLLELPPGTSEHIFPAGGETCPGIYTATAEFSNKYLSDSVLNFFVVNPVSVVTVDQHHGFDACHPPTVEEMQTWWDTSPYYVYNLYLGGSMFACADEPLDPFWVHQVAGQGWEFILSWVGPQAPCTGFRERMSSSPAVAYQEGRAEAQLAVEAADQLGLLGDRVIYYDVEGYASASAACRSAVNSFIQGWTDELHDQGYQAGAYGGACSSYLADWAANSPPPDDVWIAHWSYSSYNPEATVWDAPCVSNNYWDGHQRIKQYAGGHNETWGSVTLNIDSDVLDGEVTAIPFGGLGRSGETPAATLTGYGLPWEDVGLLNPVEGWTRTDTQLWVTSDGGLSWEEISPDFTRLLDVAYGDEGQIWVVGLGDVTADASFAVSQDRGASWAYHTITASMEAALAVVEAAIEFSLAGWAQVALRRATGSSFTLGEVYVSPDGGETWQEVAAAPEAELDFASTFPAAARIASEAPFDLPQGTVAADFAGSSAAWVVVQQGGCQGDKAGPAGLTCIRTWKLMATEDAGNTWVDIGPG